MPVYVFWLMWCGSLFFISYFTQLHLSINLNVTRSLTNTSLSLLFIPNLMSHPHHTSKKEEVSTAFDTLIPSLEAIAAGFKDMHKQMNKLKRVNDNLVDFNDSFGAFLFGLAANDTTVKWRSVRNIDIVIGTRPFLLIDDPCSPLPRAKLQSTRNI